MESSQCGWARMEGERGGPSHSAGLHWLAVVWLMLSDIVGTSVLTLTGVARHLGYVLTVAFIVGMLPMSLHVSVLMSRTRQLLLAQFRIESEKWAQPPLLGSMAEVARSAFRSDFAAAATSAVVYGYTFLGNSSYLLVLGTSFQMSFPDVGLCLHWCVALGCALLVPAICCFRDLQDSVALCAVNTALILVVIGVALYSIAGQSAPPRHREESMAFAPDLGLYSAMGAATNVLYSFAGQWMYFEIMSTMAEPTDFPRVFVVVGPFMVITYLVVAIAGLLLYAQGEDLLRSMHAGTARQVACQHLLFAYVVVVYLIKSIILTRFVHGVISPQDHESRSWTSYLKHSGIGLAMLWMGFLVANAVPFFSELLGLVGGLLSGPINFIFPIVLFLVARRRALATISRPTDAESWEAEGQLEDGQSRDDVSDEAASSISEVSSAASTEASQGKDVETVGALCAMRPLDWALIACTVSFTLMTMVFGVSDVLSQIADLEGQYGAPFTCKTLEFDDVSQIPCKTLESS